MAALTLPEPAGRWGVVGARSIIRGCGRGKPSDVRCGRRRDNNITTWDPHGFNLEVALDVVLTGEESPRSNLHKKSVDRALVVHRHRPPAAPSHQVNLSNPSPLVSPAAA
jgi:hypothetical protein